MSAGHTPGPWSAEVHELSEGFSGIVYDRSGNAMVDHLSEPDAHLISAAPDLLSALENLLAIHPAGSWPPACVMAYRAIEKAKGVTS